MQTKPNGNQLLFQKTEEEEGKRIAINFNEVAVGKIIICILKYNAYRVLAVAQTDFARR